MGNRNQFDSGRRIYSKMNMKEVIVVGAGGHGAEIDDYINYNNKYTEQQLKIKGYLDDNPEIIIVICFPAHYLAA